MAKESAEPKGAKKGKAAASAPKVEWNDAEMKTTYANVCNVLSSREEVTFLFGTNQTLYTGQDTVTVDLSNRVILSPNRAKVLLIMLNNVLAEYEKRYGQVTVEAAPGPQADA